MVKIMESSVVVHTASPSRKALGIVMMMISMGLSFFVAGTAYIESHKLTIKNEASQALFETSDFGMSLADAEGKIIQWSKGLEDLTGYSESDVLGKDISVMLPEEYRDQHEKAYKNAINDPHSYKKFNRIRCQLQPKNKNAKPINVVVSVRVYQSKYGNVFSMAHMVRASDIKEVVMPPLNASASK